MAGSGLAGRPGSFKVLLVRAMGGVVSCVALCIAGHAAAAILDAGVSHNLAVTSTGRVVAWGENTSGSLGNGTRVHSSTPVRSGTLNGATAVAAGRGPSVALLANGTVWTWGSGEGLAPGAASTCFTQPCSLTPIQVPGLADARAIAVSSTGHFVVALLANGTVRAWGTNRHGTLGNGTTVDQAVPVAVSGLANITAIAAGRDHAVALRSDGTVWTWGLNVRGELGASLAVTAANTCDGDPCAKTPVQVVRSPGVPLTNVSAIAAKGRHTLARRTDATVWAWGSNYYGQVGVGTVSDRPFPIQVLTAVASIATGVSHSIALRQDGSYWAWGLNLSSSRQLGITGLFVVESCPARPIAPGLTTNYMIGDPWSCKKSPTNTGRSGVASVSGGGAHTLAVRADGSIDAFGLNSYGQLGTEAVRVFVATACYSDPASCPGSPQGAAASGVSIGQASTSGALNLGTLEEGIEFAAQPIGTTSASREVRIRNVSSTPTLQIRILSVTATGDFVAQSTCASTLLAVEASCGVFVTFSPTGPGARAGTLTVTTDQADSPTGRLELQGTGTGHALAVTKQGTGSGTVSSSPAGISCGSTCTAHYAPNATVTLTQSADGGSTFGGWSGDCSGAGACVVTMNAAKNVTATFTAAAPTTHTLSVSRAGTGSGTVSSSPAGINCGSTCSAGFPAATAVTLTASASPGSTFTGWSSPCSGTGACTVTMNAASSVTATFTTTAATTHVLTVSRTGTGSGTVVSSPAGINCGSACSVGFPAGTSVTLSAFPASGSTFAGWSSACSGTGACTVAMNAAVALTASFNASQAITTVTAKTLGSRATISPNATLYGGFATGSSGQVYILVRGNSLGTLGVTQGFLDAPRVRVFDAQGQDIISDAGGRPGFNGCDSANSAAAAVVSYYQNVRGQPAHARDGCFARVLQAGVYTFSVTPSVAGVNTGGVSSAPSGGEALFEVTLGGGSGSVTNSLGSRATVSRTATHFGGFDLASQARVYILVRGNSLGTLGVTQGYLDAPRVRIYDAVGRDLVTDQSGRAGFNNCLASNASSAPVANYYQNVRGQAAHARDACIAQDLSPGTYTFSVTPSIPGVTTASMESAPQSGEVLFEVTLGP